MKCYTLKNRLFVHFVNIIQSRYVRFYLSLLYIVYMIYLTCVGHIQEMSGNVQEMSPTYTCRRFPQNTFCLSCMQEICPTHQNSCVQEMCLKYHLYCVLILSFMPPNLVIGNVPEMSCVLATGNLPEILPYTVPGNVKKMSKFPGVGNVHTMTRKCELSCTFYGISWPKKFRISSSASYLPIYVQITYLPLRSCTTPTV